MMQMTITFNNLCHEKHISVTTIKSCARHVLVYFNMLRISKSVHLISQGYHFDNNGRKFVRIFATLNAIIVRIKIPKKKTMHIKSISPDFPYKFVNDWVEIIIRHNEVPSRNYDATEDYINRRCEEVWFTD